MIGAVFVVASTQMISTFIYDVDQIFVDYTDFNLGTIRYIQQYIHSTKSSAADLSIVDDAYQIAENFEKSRKDNISNGLVLLAHFVEAIMYLTVILVFFIFVMGIVAGWMHFPKFAVFLSMVLIIILALVWIDFTVAYGASNVLNKMCDTINNCHFCYAGQLPGCPFENGSPVACQVPWFQTMSECSPESQNRFTNLTNYLNSNAVTLGTQTCTAIHNLCQQYHCIYKNGDCTGSRIVNNNALDVWMTLADNVTVVDIPTAATMNITLANVVMGVFGQVTNYNDMLSQLSSLNCGAPNAYVEAVYGPGGIGYDGTYDRLQEQLCPAMTKPQYSIFQMVQFLAVGLAIMGIFIPCAQVILCLGDKRWRRNAYQPLLLSNDYGGTYGTEINDVLPNGTSFFGSS